MYFTKTPLIVRHFFKETTWKIPTKEKNIYLTFDDGPTPEVTDWTLSTLKDFNARATFFCLGKNIKLYPDIFKRIAEGNHTIGNHTFDHLNGWKTPDTQYFENVEKCEEQIKKEGGTSKCLFRPPYGKIRKTQLAKLKLKYKIVFWDILSGDFDQKIPEGKCFGNVSKNAEKGSVVVFHDSVKAAKNLYYSLPKTLEYFSGMGFRFEAL